MNDDNEELEDSKSARRPLDTIRDWFLNHMDKLGSNHAHQIAVWLAARSAARLFPLAWQEQNNMLIIPTLWSLTISRVVAAFPFLKDDHLSKTAANVASRVAFSTLDYNKEAADAAMSASCAAQAISSAPVPFVLEIGDFDYGSAFTQACYAADFEPSLMLNDQLWLERNDYFIVDKLLLWHGEDNKITADYAALKQKLQRDFGDTWSFFLDDYDRQLAGEIPDWHVLKALAHPDAIEVWQSNDPRQLADYIRQIQEARDAGSDSPSEASDSLTDTLEAIAHKTPIGANLQLHSESGLIEEVSLTDSTDHQLDHAIAEMTEAFHTFDDLSGNFRTLMAPVRSKLERLLSRPNPEANRVFSIATKAHLQIIDLSYSNEFGDPKKDPHLNTTIRHLETAAACVIFHEDVKPIIDATIDVAALGDALDISNPVSDFNMLVDLSTAASEPDLAANIEADREIIQDPNADEQAKQIAWHYLLGIVSRIGLVALGMPSDALLFTIPEIALFIKSEARRLLWDVLRDLVKESLKDWFRVE